MKIKEIKENKKQFLPLLLLADEQEDMIDRYLNRGIMYVLDDDGVKCECVVTDEGKGVLEIKNIATEPEYQGNEYVKNKGIVKKHKEKFTDKFKEEINSLKNTKYSSIYVVVCLIEQAVFLELLKDLTQLMSNDKIRLLFYAGGGILSFVIMLKILDMLVKKAGKKIEDDVLMEMQSKGEYVPEKTDKIVECATMLGYMSPFLCVSTWISGIENTQIYKWGIIILVHILGIGIPLLVKKKK